jgi:hypothetical protein
MLIKRQFLFVFPWLARCIQAGHTPWRILWAQLNES